MPKIDWCFILCLIVTALTHRRNVFQIRLLQLLQLLVYFSCYSCSSTLAVTTPNTSPSAPLIGWKLFNCPNFLLPLTTFQLSTFSLFHTRHFFHFRHKTQGQNESHSIIKEFFQDNVNFHKQFFLSKTFIWCHLLTEESSLSKGTCCL